MPEHRRALGHGEGFEDVAAVAHLPGQSFSRNVVILKQKNEIFEFKVLEQKM